MANLMRKQDERLRLQIFFPENGAIDVLKSIIRRSADKERTATKTRSRKRKEGRNSGGRHDLESCV